MTTQPTPEPSAEPVTERTATLEIIIDGHPHKLVSQYGISNPARPYFSVTGELYERRSNNRYSREPDACGMLHEVIAEHMPWLGTLISLHLCDARTGEPLHALANSWYWFSSPHEDPNFSMPRPYRPLDRAQRAASYLGCDPALFAHVSDTGPTAKAAFTEAVDSLRPVWARQAADALTLYRLTLPASADQE